MLLFFIGIGVLVIIGLIWAISSGTPKTAGDGSFDDTDSPRKGAENGELVIHMFEDFQCPACRSAGSGVRHAISTYGDRVTFIWKDFPLQTIHPNALSAANAARCAQEQGKFWEYHDRLFDDQPSWSQLPDTTQKFTDYASALALDVDAWASCYGERRFQGNVLRDVREGDALGLNGTPSFFVGDQLISRVMSATEWDQVLQAALTFE